MTADEHPVAQDLAKMGFRQIVQFIESQDTAPTIEAMDTADIFRRFPELANVGVRDVTIDGTHGDIPGRIYTSSDAATIGFVWVHGGAFIGGGLEMPEAHWASLAVASRGFSVLSLDYHKALRGVHFPVPSDDVLDGWRWATTHADQLGVAPEDLHLGGASAGGNLVAGVTKRLRDGAGPLPASLVLVYPIVHPELPPLPSELVEMMATDERASSFPAESVREMNLQYAGSEGALSDPYAFAANGHLSGQPPVFILNSEADYLRASGEAYGDGLRNAGVEVTVATERGTHHGHLSGPDEPGAISSIDRLTKWLQEHHRSGRVVEDE
jgi:acetyl esterase